MPSRREIPDLVQLVSDQLIAALPNIVSHVAAGLNANQTSSSESRPQRECTYKTFRACNPKEFNGTKGAVELLSWLENVESVLHISKCTEGNKVKYAACLLQGRALTWWNTIVQTRGREAANRLSWEEFKKLLKDEYCPRSKLQKMEMELWNLEMKGENISAYTTRFHELANLVPHLTIQEAVEIATKLTNNAVRSGGLAKEKRKIEEYGDRRIGRKFDKSRRMAKNVRAQSQVIRQGDAERCNKCKFPHLGNCITCQRCRLGGHTAKDCRKRLCYECGSPDHIRNDYPKRKTMANVNQNRQNSAGNSGSQARGRAFELGAREARKDPSVVTVKAEHQKPSGLLQQLEIPQWKWE
ncbi:uncharacterized protein LOC112506118 [Cynara cardunculus var. scolymus]|uniref:uncharacterized protein LOC112506118 n=1 Tax=Cynara cardunculus var. scolymus TaxID=59895 RepID=UPI000D625754|nr:uncharacterized protein LOC112506118 [Cynara cardunculus var. scolymus]